MLDSLEMKKEAKDRVFVIRHNIHKEKYGADHSINMAEHFPELQKAGSVRYPIKIWFQEHVPLGGVHAGAGCRMYRDFLLSFGVGSIRVERATFDQAGSPAEIEVLEEIKSQGEFS